MKVPQETNGGVGKNIVYSTVTILDCWSSIYVQQLFLKHNISYNQLK